MYTFITKTLYTFFIHISYLSTYIFIYSFIFVYWFFISLVQIEDTKM